MAEYQPPLEEIRFALRHHAKLSELLDFPQFKAFDDELVQGLLVEAGKFMSEVISPLNVVGDREGSKLVDGQVITPPGYKEAYAQLVEAGWISVCADEEWGGTGLPFSVYTAVFEMFCSANMAFVLCPSLADGAIHALASHATDELKNTFLRPLVEGTWGGTMDLTEPEAGSDVGALRTRAERQPDGTYHIRGGKIFITFGDHDLTENIIHLVLARTADAPGGSRGISLFIVPKRLVDADGNPGEDNGVRVVSIEHKMGIHASPTCVLSYGEDKPTVGYLIGEENMGLNYMFTMMNRERIYVGNQGLSIGQRAYQKAVEYSREREQGRAAGAEVERGKSSPIIDHPDVRRMLLTMRSELEAMRALLHQVSALADAAAHHPDAALREQAGEREALITPVVKAWLTDLGVEVTSHALQVHGGLGYIEETGVSQYYRDARIPPIYEGTNGVQAMDLVMRKMPMKGGQVVADYIEELRETQAALSAAGGDLGELAAPFAEGIDALEAATRWLLERSGVDPRAGASGASPYLRLFGFVAGAGCVAHSALAARAEDPSDWSEGFLEDKQSVARFFIQQLLPPATALLPAITADSEPLFAIDPDRY